MKRLIALAHFSLLICAANVTPALAGTYTINKITEINVQSSGRVYISWAGAPSPGPCGANYGWVVIPEPDTAFKEIKALAMSLYLSGRPITLNTSGCYGTAEKVADLTGR